MFTRIGAAAFKNDLTNTIALCDVLNNPQEKFSCIHIAGTNGKGSTSHMLASVLQEAGLKVGLYTSPHLRDFRERIKINGEMISEQYIVDFVEQHKQVFDNIQPSFFEWTVALCFDYFAKQEVDIAIVETGLGGRLDSTNIITPILSVITNIGWDHMDLLGDTLPKIAAEKAGIIKPNVPVVIGEFQSEVHDVFTEKAHSENSKLILASDIVTLQSFTNNNFESTFSVAKDNKIWIENVSCDLPGIYQQHNIKTVLAALLQLPEQDFAISDQHIMNGLKNVKRNTGLMGRWQVLGENPLVICDTGHNVNGIRYVVEQIAKTRHENLHMVIGMVKDKDIAKVLSLLPKQAIYYFCNANIPRALPAEELSEQAEQFGLYGSWHPSVYSALEFAKQQAQPNDLIFIGGSTFVVAEIV
jgi:dihydrofolate synthase/folylpolyglutamate synthase